MTRLPTSTLNRKTLSLTILSLLFCAFIPIFPGWNFFYGHVFFWIWCSWIALKPLLNNNAKHFLPIAFTAFSLLVLYLFHHYNFEPEHRFAQDSAKIAFFILSLFATATAARKEDLYSLLIKFIIIFPAVFLVRFLIFKTDDWFGYSGRLYDELFGSPNVVGTFSGIAIIFLLSNQSAKINLILRISLITFYASLIVLGFSRSAIIATALASLLLLDKKIILAAALSTAVLLLSLSLTNLEISYGPQWISQKADILGDLRETGGSGRVHLWILSIERLFSGADTLLFGQGPGRVIEYMDYGKIADHPHNFYLFTALGYGLPVFFAFLSGWTYSCYRAALLFIAGNKLPLSISFFYGVSFIFDTHVLASQFIVPHVLAFSIFIRETIISRRRIGAPKENKLEI